ncbi:MAG: hypothetical protein NTX14_02370 [Candidatus Nealsonbacteria bacterium]|nr:hypothetical protein [Candidatus Nealsonbacteria bacterium]
MINFVPKKPVKSFLDLEVYQKLLEAAVFVAKYIAVPLPTLSAVRSESQGDAEPKVQTGHAATSGNIGSGTFGGGAAELIFHQMLPCALGLPHLIAEAHSVRFGGKKDCLILLERAMLHCNKMVVYLEETRDIADTGVPTEKFNELVKKYLYIRQKILNLQRSWKKYMGEG